MASNENGEASDEKPEPKGIDIALNETGQFDIPEDFVEEEKSVFQKPGNLTMQDAVPVIPKRAAIACFVLNLMCPGLGTAVSAFALMIWPCEEHMAKRWSEVFILNITAAILQLIMTIYLLIGYFWGIWWGVIMIQRAPSRSTEQVFRIKFTFTRQYVRKY